MNTVADVSEIKKNSWPFITDETIELEDSAWDILNHDSSDQGSTRYWFKQNYIAWASNEQIQITYH